MPTTLSAENLVLGSKVYFVRNGSSFTVPSAGTSDSSNVPGDADTSWTEIGDLKEVRATPARGDALEVWVPNPGGLRLKDVIRAKRDIKWQFTSQSTSPLALEHLFGTAALTSSSATFVPLAKVGVLKGWLRWELYDQTDSKRITSKVYVELSIASDVTFDPDNKLVEVQWEARALIAGTALAGTIAAAS